MAKNKNRKGTHQQRAAAAERSKEESRSTAFEERAQPQSQAQGSPADVARKHQRRFGHN
ncbi:hypothetical protein [Streptomyces clavuligerus]|uniref:hypothetical protein n=1 Tax=Streptomyces clavuligerus TaxID=1901 RepID=UPI00020D963C|nr:hypothetical protein [Streptomyces clavuligerus]MBY6305350.1 hypothetical protein [Streptomyces clavuligerus]QPL65271.1 hypothetical protein I3J04_22025 [Streptomyces clavuligerus]QPL71302.1 hypothetical protein I3J05_22035 [Streptomyces clavuligerus]QPL77384.1 hypothetical protein I3J06_22040 [Streptomyces clavuligerus]QPL83409.1 hypothetical protein I3J07_22075 [Streptomyces clavuligerus]